MQRNPPFFTTENLISNSDLKMMREMYFLNKRDFDFILSVRNSVEGHKAEDNAEISIDEFKTSEVKTTNGIRKKLNKLVEIGILKKRHEKRSEWFKPITIYGFKKSITEKNLESNIIPSYSKKEATSVSQSYQLNGPELGDFFIQLMFLGLSINQSDSFKSKEEIIHIKNQSLSIKLSSSFISKSYLATIYDFRFFVAALSLCENEVIKRNLEGQSCDNFFEFNSSSINNLLSRDNTGGNISSLVNAFKRLSDSTFCLEEWPSFIKEKYDIEEAILKISPVSNLTITKQKNKTFIAFSIPYSIFKSFQFNNSKIIRFNKTLLSERNEVLFALNIYMRRIFIGSSASIKGPFSIVELHKNIASHLTYKDFKTKLFSGLIDVFNDHVASGKNPVDVISKQGMKRTSNSQSIKHQLQTPIIDENQDIVSYFAEVQGYYLKISGDKYTVIIKNTDLSNPYPVLSNLKESPKNAQTQPKQGAFEF